MRCAVALFAFLLSGCAAMTQSACGAGASWYELGERDGLIGVLPRIDTYAYQCSRQDAQVSAADYMNGWWIGNATYRDRTAGSETN